MDTPVSNTVEYKAVTADVVVKITRNPAGKVLISQSYTPDQVTAMEKQPTALLADLETIKALFNTVE